MTARNPVEASPPVVARLERELTRRLGRRAAVRQVNNAPEWYVADPVFSFLQRGRVNHANGYRVGLHYDGDVNELSFRIVHSPAMAEFLKENLSLATLRRTVARTASTCEDSAVWWSSRQAIRDGEHLGTRTLLGPAGEVLAELDQLTDEAFTRDLFPRVPGATWRGSYFGVHLADRASRLSVAALVEIVDVAWPLVLALYPQAPAERRDASLARRLRSMVPRACEFLQIRDLPKVAAMACAGRIEGAHIVPHARGGSDLLKNGLWLCAAHHRVTEGKLAGTRTATTVDVRFVP